MRMFLEHRLELLKPLLSGLIDTVNQHAPPGTPRVDIRRGDRGAPFVGEAQVLRFLSDKSSRMHVHVDKPGTRWVALMSLGDSSTFLLDHAPRCKRCWTGGGTGSGGKAKWKEWHNVDCPTCRQLTFASGDCLLFYGDPSAGVAHGTLKTLRDTAPSHLPSWCKGGRVSCQHRQTEIRDNVAACGAYD